MIGDLGAPEAELAALAGASVAERVRRARASRGRSLTRDPPAARTHDHFRVRAPERRVDELDPPSGARHACGDLERPDRGRTHDVEADARETRAVDSADAVDLARQKRRRWTAVLMGRIPLAARQLARHVDPTLAFVHGARQLAHLGASIAARPA